MKIKSFYRDGNKHIIEFIDGRKVEVGLTELKRSDRSLLELIDDLVNPLDAKLVVIDDNIKVWTKNKLNAIEQHLLDIKAYLGI